MMEFDISSFNWDKKKNILVMKEVLIGTNLTSLIQIKGKKSTILYYFSHSDYVKKQLHYIFKTNHKNDDIDFPEVRFRVKTCAVRHN